MIVSIRIRYMELKGERGHPLEKVVGIPGIRYMELKGLAWVRILPGASRESVTWS